MPWGPITPYLYAHSLEDSKSASNEKARMHLDKETHNLFILFLLSLHHIHFLMGKIFFQSLKFQTLFLNFFYNYMVQPGGEQITFFTSVDTIKHYDFQPPRKVG